MGKNVKKPAQTPPPAPKTEEKKAVNVVQVGDLMNNIKDKGNQQRTSLSPDATVMALNGLKCMVHDNPNAADYYGLGEEAVKNINKFTLAGFATILAVEVVENKSAFAMHMLEKQIDAVNAIAEYTGVHIDAKALPAPAKDGKITVTSAAVKVSKEAEKKIKEEKKIAEKAVDDPTKIENDEQLKASLVAVLSDMKEPRPYDRINKAIIFYNSYLEFQASKSENKDEELAKVKELSKADILRKIADIAGPNVYALEGICKLLRSFINDTDSPVSAYCLFRNASINPKNGAHIDDALVADIVKILIIWSGDAGIAAQERNIAESKRIMEKNKDKVGIVNAEKEKIKKYEANIAYYKHVSDIVTSPSTDLADKFIEAYDDEKHALHGTTRRAAKSILDSYYRGKDTKDVNKDTLLKNLQQHAGIIINMFRDSLGQSIAYKESNIVQMFPPEIPAANTAEEKK